MQFTQSIRTQVIAILFGVLLVAFSIGLWSITSTISKRFSSLENDDAKLNLERVAEIVADHLSILSTRTGDWANWDETAEFLDGNNPEWVNENLTPSVPDLLKLDSFRLYTLDKKFVAGLERPQEGSGIAYKDFIDAHQAEVMPFFGMPESRGPQVGVVQLGDRIFSYAVEPVRKTEESKPNGYILLLKEIDEPFVKKISELTKFDIKLQKEGEFKLPSTAVSRVIAMNNVRHISQALHWPENDSQMNFALAIADAAQKPLFQLTFSIARNLARQGESTSQQVAIAFSLSALFVILMLVVFIDRLVVRRILNLSHSVQHLDRRGIGIPSVAVEGRSEVAVLSQKINEMLKTIHLQNKGLIDIISNVHAGFMLTDRHGVIAPSYTHFCETIFKDRVLSGQKLSHILFESAHDRENFEVFYEQVFESFLPGDFTLDQLPKRVQLESGKFITLTGSCIYDQEGQVSEVLFTILDATHLQKTEASNRENLALLKIIRSQNRFSSFAASIRKNLDPLTQEPHKLNDQLVVRRLLHTIKGNMGIYGLGRFSTMIHHIEAKPRIDVSHIESIVREFSGFLKDHVDVLGIDYEQSGPLKIFVTKAQLTGLIANTDACQSLEQANTSVKEFVREVTLVPFKDHGDSLVEYAQRVAKNLSKKVVIELRGGEVKVDSEYLKDVLESLVHVIRNAIDHGIEHPNVRQGKKSAEGHITIGAERREDGYLIITVEDDGQGISASTISKSAVRKKLLSEQKALMMSESELIDLIFLDGFSTRESSDETSGCGVGMATVLSSAQALGGKVTIKTATNEGTTIAIHIPPQFSSAITLQGVKVG